MGHLLGIAVEWQRLPARKLANSSLAGLRPAGMVHSRVDVCIKAVLIGGRLHPEGRWLGSDQVDLHDGFDALESILPGNDQSNRSSILRRQRIAIKSGCE